MPVEVGVSVPTKSLSRPQWLGSFLLSSRRQAQASSIRPSRFPRRREGLRRSTEFRPSLAIVQPKTA